MSSIQTKITTQDEVQALCKSDTMCDATMKGVQELIIGNCELSQRVDIHKSRLNNLSSEIQDCYEDLREISVTEVPPEIVFIYTNSAHGQNSSQLTPLRDGTRWIRVNCVIPAWLPRMCAVPGDVVVRIQFLKL